MHNLLMKYSEWNNYSCCFEHEFLFKPWREESVYLQCKKMGRTFSVFNEIVWEHFIQESYSRNYSPYSFGKCNSHFHLCSPCVHSIYRTSTGATLPLTWSSSPGTQKFYLQVLNYISFWLLLFKSWNSVYFYFHPTFFSL